MDGARIFNAQAATGVSINEMAEKTDSITFCLSKGLGAPAGALLCGSRDFINEAKIVRKMLGGGMRQAGILAAAGIYALQNNIGKIADDHRHAKAVAGALDTTDWAQDTSGETNILFCNVKQGTAVSVSEKLKSRGLLCIPMTESSIRFVLHLDISEKDAEDVCNIIKEI
jgi:threonine aldolase